jgi:hypothetical protein
VVELEQEDGSAASSSSPPAPRASICGGMARARESTALRRPRLRRGVLLHQGRRPALLICAGEGDGDRRPGSARIDSPGQQHKCQAFSVLHDLMRSVGATGSIRVVRAARTPLVASASSALVWPPRTRGHFGKHGDACRSFSLNSICFASRQMLRLGDS